MIAAGMASTAVITTGVAFAMFMIVVTAADIGVKAQLTGKESFYSFVGLAGNAAVKADIGSCQCHLCAAADAAADEDIDALAGEQARQCAVALSVGTDDFGRNDLTVFHVIYFELFTVPKVLEHIPVFVCNRDSHNSDSSNNALPDSAGSASL